MKFEKEPLNSVSAHRPIGDIDLNQVFCWEFERKVSNDWCITFKNKHFQVEKRYGDLIRPNSKIYVRKFLDETLNFWYKDRPVIVKELLPKAEKSKLTTIKIEQNRMNKRMAGKIARQKSPWGRYGYFRNKTTKMCAEMS